MNYFDAQLIYLICAILSCISLSIAIVFYNCQGDKKNYSLRIINLICISDFIFCFSYGCFDYILLQDIQIFILECTFATINDYGFGLSSGFILVIAVITYKQMIYSSEIQTNLYIAQVNVLALVYTLINTFPLFPNCAAWLVFAVNLINLIFVAVITLVIMALYLRVVYVLHNEYSFKVSRLTKLFLFPIFYVICQFTSPLDVLIATYEGNTPFVKGLVVYNEIASNLYGVVDAMLYSYYLYFENKANQSSSINDSELIVERYSQQGNIQKFIEVDLVS